MTLPLLAPGLAAAFCLVFLSAVTELTATLILVPTDVQTLSTQFWAYQQNLSYGQAAPFALLIIVIAAVPSLYPGTIVRSDAVEAARHLTDGVISDQPGAWSGLVKGFGANRC